MPIFQINQLPTIPQAPADADVLAIEVNGITYKVSKQALAAAIAANITPSDIGALPSTTTYVSGVKGNSESTYRNGQVNITSDNIGALPLSGGTMTGGISPEHFHTQINQKEKASSS